MNRKSRTRFRIVGLAALLLVAASPRRTYLRTLQSWTDEIKLYPVEEVSDLVNLQAGVVNGGR